MDHNGAVVVGLGATRFDTPELDWAAREAQSRNRPLHIVRAHDPSDVAVPWDEAIDATLMGELRRASEEHIRQAVVHMRRTWPELLVWGTVVDGRAADILCAASREAEVTVVGSRRLTALDAAVLGSVSAVLATRGSGAVVVVSGIAEDSVQRPAVVVGVDGAAHTDAALAFAFDFASRHGHPLRAVYCWSPDLLASMQWRPAPPAPERADRWLAEAIAGWQEKYPDVDVRREVVHEHATGGLVTRSAGQELLVVGSHSRRGRLASLLGSVSQGVLHHAICPVAVVHPQGTDPSEH